MVDGLGSYTEQTGYFLHLGLSLAVGLIIGVERGWKSREEPEERSLAGLRTYLLAGLSGGITALLADRYGVMLMAVGLLVFGAIMISINALRVGDRADRPVEASSLVAAMLTYLLGGLAMQPGMESEAAASAVVGAVVLSLKRHLEGALRNIQVQEMQALLWMLLITVVVLPLLPNQGYGPWQALNPYQIWWMVVLIAGISFAGYFAMKLVGTDRGILFTGLIGGLVSSTALSLHMARLARERSDLHGAIAAGLLVAWGTMFVRVALVALVLNQILGVELVLTLGVAALGCFLASIILWQRNQVGRPSLEAPVSNPLNLRSAIHFALLLAVLLLAVRAGNAWLGETGLYLVALLSGLTDVDAINLSMTQVVGESVPLPVGALAVLLACTSNSVVKSVMVVWLGHVHLARLAVIPLMLALAASWLAYWQVTLLR